MRKAILGLLLAGLLIGAAWASDDWDEWYLDPQPVDTEDSDEAPAYDYGLNRGQVMGPMWGVPKDAAWWHDYMQTSGMMRIDTERRERQAEPLPYEMLHYYYAGERDRTHHEGQVFGPMWGVPPEAVGLDTYAPYYPYYLGPAPEQQAGSDQSEEAADESTDDDDEEMWYE